MKMMIEESIKVLQEVPKVMPITKESINVALETMRRYQKIEQIIEGYFAPFSQDIASQCMREIKEVIEDESESYD